MFIYRVRNHVLEHTAFNNFGLLQFDISSIEHAAFDFCATANSHTLPAGSHLRFTYSNLAFGGADYRSLALMPVSKPEILSCFVSRGVMPNTHSRLACISHNVSDGAPPCEDQLVDDAFRCAWWTAHLPEGVLKRANDEVWGALRVLKEKSFASAKSPVSQ